ncbi:MAG: saccharopine dehydrogenase NADP-binding domain-containing protein [Myxococcota bacterium]
MSDRRYEIVVWGATGYTGRLTADYIARHGPGDLRWALGGRNRDKLEALRSELVASAGVAADLPLVVGDSHDPSRLAEIAAETDVVCTTVGPYLKYGRALVDACVAAGTHYCDLTGETPFIREMIDRHHRRAGETGARIVHCCGYDSIPSDLGAFMLQEAAHERFGRPCVTVKNYVGRSKGTVSGGTVASMLTIAELASDPRVRRVLGHPYGLNPEGERQGPDGSDAVGLGIDRDVGCFTAPFVMAAINTRIVRRTNALLDYRYGRAFRFEEKMMLPLSAPGFAMASAFTVGMAGLLAGMAIPPVRSLLRDRVLPAPGEGPTAQQRDEGYFNHHLFGTVDTPDGGTRTLRGEVVGVNDPGYGETSKMLAESALCLARDPLTSEAGVLTPAVAMGTHLLTRLRDAGMTFSVD